MRVFSHYVFVLSSIVLGIILVFDLLSNPVYDLGQHNIYIPQNNYIIVPEYYYDVFCVTREVPVEKQITSNKSGDSPVVLADWTSTEELEDFLAADDTDSRLVLTADSNGTVEFDGICEDRALQLRDRAMLQGKFLSVEILHRDERTQSLRP